MRSFYEQYGLTVPAPGQVTECVCTCSIAQLNEGIQVGLPYLTAVYMVRDWLGSEASEEKASRMTGLLVQALQSMPFMRASQHKRNTLLPSTVQSLLCFWQLHSWKELFGHTGLSM